MCTNGIYSFGFSIVKRDEQLTHIEVRFLMNLSACGIKPSLLCCITLLDPDLMFDKWSKTLTCKPSLIWGQHQALHGKHTVGNSWKMSFDAEMVFDVSMPGHIATCEKRWTRTMVDRKFCCRALRNSRHSGIPQTKSDLQLGSQQVDRMLRVISAMMHGDAVAKTRHETWKIMKCTGPQGGHRKNGYPFQQIHDSMHHAGSGWELALSKRYVVYKDPVYGEVCYSAAGWFNQF